MRITGGQFRGRNLAEPPDNRVRPTSDKVRQAIFNILAHNAFGFDLAGAKHVSGKSPDAPHQAGQSVLTGIDPPNDVAHR